MAKRRIKSNPYSKDSNVNQSDILTSLGGLENVSDLLLENQGLEDEGGLEGTAKKENLETDAEFPNVRIVPYEDEENQQINEDLSLLSNLSGLEEEEAPPEDIQKEDLETEGEKGTDYLSMLKSLGENVKPLLNPPRFLADKVADWANPENRKKQQEENVKLSAQAKEGSKLAEEAAQKGMTVEEYRTLNADEHKEDQDRWSQEVEEASQNPFTKSVYGATDAVFNSPQLVETIQTIGIPVSDEMQQMTKNMEAAISDMDERELKAQGVWNEQIANIRNRIESNQATDTDKFVIGLALLMPLIVGGIFGADVGLGALEGTMEGLAKGKQSREKAIREDEKMIADLTKELDKSEQKRGEIKLERMKIPETIKKITPDSPYAHLQGMNLVTYTDPSGNQVQGVRFSPGIVADIEYLDDKDAKKDMRIKADKLNENRDSVNRLGDNIRKVIEIANQIEDPSTVEKIFQIWAKGKKPSLVSKFGQDIVLDGRKVNSAVALTQLLEDTLEQRRNVQKIKNFGPQLFDHFERILTNPYGEFVSPQDLIDQSLRLYTNTRDQFLDSAESRGFLRIPLIEDFYEKDKKMYGMLNRKEAMKRSREMEGLRKSSEMDIPNG